MVQSLPGTPFDHLYSPNASDSPRGMVHLQVEVMKAERERRYMECARLLWNPRWNPFWISTVGKMGIACGGLELHHIQHSQRNYV